MINKYTVTNVIISITMIIFGLIFISWFINNNELFLFFIKLILIISFFIPFDKNGNTNICPDSFTAKYIQSAINGHIIKIIAYINYTKYNQQNQCLICLNQINFNYNNLQLLKCGHIFHKHCIEYNEYHNAYGNYSLNYQISKCPY
eukprot:154448_1